MKIQNKNQSNNLTPNFKRNLICGYSIIEILVYLAIFTALSIVVINSFIVILSSFNTTNMNRKLLESGSVVMERMSREIRQANSVDIAGSSFGSSPGVLQLNSTDESNNGIVIKFAVVDQALNLYQDGNLLGNLLGQNVSITSLIFRKISTTNSEAAKIEMTLQYSKGQMIKSVNFYDTIVLRGGY